MGRIVIVDTGFQSVSAVQDLLEVKVGTGQTALIHRAKVIQKSDEQASDAEELEINLKRGSGSFTSGSGGGTPTVVKGSTGDAAHGLAATERNNTTQALVGTGALDILEPGVFNVLAGEWEFAGTPELRYPLAPSEAVILSLDEAPSDPITMRAIVILEIIAG